MTAPQNGSRNGGRVDPIDGRLKRRKEANRAQPQQALDGAGVVAEC